MKKKSLPALAGAAAAAQVFNAANAAFRTQHWQEALDAYAAAAASVCRRHNMRTQSRKMANAFPEQIRTLF